MDYLNKNGLEYFWQKMKSYISKATVSNAGKLLNARKIELDGEVQGSIIFDGSSDVKMETKIKDLIIGNEINTTAVWTGDSNIKELYDGLTINFWITATPTGNPTLKLKLKDGTYTNNIPIYLTTTTRLGTQIPSKNIIQLTYRKNPTDTISEGWWINRSYFSMNYSTLRNEEGKIYAGAGGIMNRGLCILDSDNTFQSITTTSGTGTNKTINTEAKFKNPMIMYYYNASSDVSGGNLMSSTYVLLSVYLTCDLRYSCNNYSELETYKPTYLECEKTSDGFLKVTGKIKQKDFLTGYYYVFLGLTYKVNYQLSLTQIHPTYYYDGTNLTTFENEYYAGKGLYYTTNRKFNVLTDDGLKVGDDNCVGINLTKNSGLTVHAPGETINGDTFYNALGILCNDTLEIDSDGKLGVKERHLLGINTTLALIDLTLNNNINLFEELEIVWKDHEGRTKISFYKVEDTIKISEELGHIANDTTYQKVFAEYNISTNKITYVNSGFINIVNNTTPRLYDVGNKQALTKLVIYKIYGIRTNYKE